VVATPVVDILAVWALALIFFFDIARATVDTINRTPTMPLATKNESSTSHCNIHMCTQTNRYGMRCDATPHHTTPRQERTEERRGEGREERGGERGGIYMASV
jgi:hypothetical protein